MRRISPFSVVIVIAGNFATACNGIGPIPGGEGGATTQAGNSSIGGSDSQSSGGATSGGVATGGSVPGTTQTNVSLLERFGIPSDAPPGLVGRAVLPAATFVDGPVSGAFIGSYFSAQPVQGFSSLVDLYDGSFYALADNGYGAIENSADFRLRVYRVRPELKTRDQGTGNVSVESYLELRDPDHRVKFAISNEFTPDRVLTGADFDTESLRVAKDGSLWIGDEFGPFLLHFDGSGKLLEAPISIPDPDSADTVLRSPQNPWLEEASTVRLMNAFRQRGITYGATKVPILSPWHVHLIDADTTGNRGFNTQRDNLSSPNSPGMNGDTGLTAANDEFIRLNKSPGAFPNLQSSGYSVVTWTVNDPARMLELLKLGVNGMISDRPDLLYQVVAAFDANGDGISGDYLDADGLVDPKKFDAEGHRGGRNLRPENTLPAMEAGLDSLVNTLETDCGLTADNIPVLYHDRVFRAELPGETGGKSRRKLGDAVPDRIRDVLLSDIQDPFDPLINDGVIRTGTPQTSDVSLSPVTVAFWKSKGRPDSRGDAYLMPTLEQLFDFADFYASYYRDGAGKSHPDATKRWKNAARVRFNVETKLSPREPENTKSPGEFVQAIGNLIMSRGLEDRTTLQSFDLRTLFLAQVDYPQIQKVVLLGDFSECPNPSSADAINGRTYCDDSTNLQPLDVFAPVTESLTDKNNSPWLGELYWPYRRTTLDFRTRTLTSGGIEGLAISPDGTKLYPLLEKPLDGLGNQIVASEFDIVTHSYTGKRFTYQYDGGNAIGEFILFSPNQGLVIERDGSQGDLKGFKRIYKVTLPGGGGAMKKELVLDLIAIPDPSRLSLGGGLPGDVGLGDPFAFPYTTIESVLLISPDTLAIVNDNNYPFSIGRHLGAKAPDDNDFIFVKLPSALY